MKEHTTNYINTFILIADDSPALTAEEPPLQENKSVARLQYEILKEQPYKYTSDDVLFTVFAIRQDLSETELEEARQNFFSKGQACLRSSPLAKRYGWGIHHDSNGKVALYPSGSEEYNNLMNDPTVKKVKAMRSKRV